MRTARNEHLARFQQAFIAWRWPAKDSAPGNPAFVADALKKWLGEWPDDHTTILRFALGGAQNAVFTADWPAARKLTGVGQQAALLGAPAGDDAFGAEALLSLLAARAALQENDVIESRSMIELAREPLERLDPYGKLARYLHLQRHFLCGSLAEAALETATAEECFRNAVEIATALASRPRALSEFQEVAIRVLWGSLPEAQMADARELFRREVGAIGFAAVLGLARTCDDPETAREAVDACVAQGLPTADSVLAVHGLLSKLPTAEIDAAADRLIAAAERLAEPYRSNWIVALRAEQAEAWLSSKDLTRARDVLHSGFRTRPRRMDAIAVSLLFAAQARADFEHNAGATLEAVETVLRSREAASGSLASSPLLLRFRAAFDPVTMAALDSQVTRLRAGRDDEASYGAGILIDAVRPLNDASMPPLAGGSESDADLRRAGDRLSRLRHAIRARREDAILALIIQQINEGTFFVSLDPGDEPVVVTEPSRAVAAAFAALSAGVERGLREPVRNIELEALGRSAFEALPAIVRAHLLRAKTIIVVPDARAGQDAVPIEMLHDGERFFGAAKAISRCPSLAYALRSIEAPLLPRATGRRALTVAVADPPGFDPLRFVDREADQVWSVLNGDGWDVHRIAAADADPDKLLELAPLSNVLHIACHGEASAGAEALVLGRGARLTAIDLATKHPLYGLTYLNACSLARSRYLGGGVSRGVAYGFARLGSRSVVANLLPVEDEGAADLATAFYRAAAHAPVGEALRQARAEAFERGNAALCSATILIGDPFLRLDGSVDTVPDATAALFDGQAIASRARLDAARAQLARDPADRRLAAAIAFSSRAAVASSKDLEALARLAREIGHSAGEAFCLVRMLKLDKGTKLSQPRREELLERAVAALQAVLHASPEAVPTMHALQSELRALDPTYSPPTVPAFRTAQGLSVNDRADPAVDAVFRILEAREQHETLWRGDPVLSLSDRTASSAAHNIVIWGHMFNLYGTGAEAAYAERCAQRLAWRGLVASEAVPHLSRILAGLSRFCWGQQKRTHLDHWLVRAQTELVQLAVTRVATLWTPPESTPARAFVRELEGVFAPLVAAGTGSRFAQARASLKAPSATSPGRAKDDPRDRVVSAIERCRQVDAHASADLAAWIVGDLMERIRVAEARGANGRAEALRLRSLDDWVLDVQESWFMPLLMQAFKAVGESGGRDVFDRWSAQMA